MVGMRIELGSARQVSDLSEHAGFPLTHSGGQPFPEVGYSTEESSTRLLGQLAGVASLVDEADRTIAYWMMNGLRSPSLPIDYGALRYELTG